MPAGPTGSPRDESVRLADWKPVPPSHSRFAVFFWSSVNEDLALK